MTVAVAKLFDVETDVHLISIVSDGETTQYVLPSGRKDPILNYDRVKNFVPTFEEEYGKKPETPEEWVTAASYNMGYLGVSDPIEKNYSDIKEAISEEQSLIDTSIKNQQEKEERSEQYPALEEGEEEKISWSVDEETFEQGNVSALLDTEKNEIAYLMAEADTSSKFLSNYIVFRENGEWTDDPSFEVDWDAIEDMDTLDVSSEYLTAFDEGDMSEETARSKEIKD